MSTSFRAEPFGVDEQDEGGVRVIAVTGELDLATAPALCARLDASRNANAPRVLVDLTGLAFCDSTGLRALLGAAAEVRLHGGRFAIACRPVGEVARLLEVVGAREHMAVHDDATSALVTLGTRPAAQAGRALRDGG
jgi:anti-sigma B factor antagonist